MRWGCVLQHDLCGIPESLRARSPMIRSLRCAPVARAPTRPRSAPER